MLALPLLHASEVWVAQTECPSGPIEQVELPVHIDASGVIGYDGCSNVPLRAIALLTRLTLLLIRPSGGVRRQRGQCVGNPDWAERERCEQHLQLCKPLVGGGVRVRKGADVVF